MPNVGVLSQKVSNHVLTETIYVLATMFGLPKGLWSRHGRVVVERFLRETEEFPVPSSMRRFMAGEFTGGEAPFHMRATSLRHFQAVLRAMDVIDALAAKHDRELGLSGSTEPVFHVEQSGPRGDPPDFRVKDGKISISQPELQDLGVNERSAALNEAQGAVLSGPSEDVPDLAGGGIVAGHLSDALNEAQDEIFTPLVEGPPKRRPGRPKGSKNKPKVKESA